MLFTGRSRPSAKAEAESANAGRQHPDSPDQEVLPDRELESYLAALSPEGDAETTGTGRRFSTPAAVQLRLSPMANEQLRELADHHRTSPAALAEEWVLQRLEWEAQHLNRR